MTAHAQHLPPQNRRFILLLGLFICVMSVLQFRQWSADRPSQPQRIAAILVSWGLFPDGVRIPVDDAEIDRHIEMLRSANGEDRVRAAHWLASHGVRDAAGAIAHAMDDPLTTRPCQLAHALGHLGDEQYADQLTRAANQPWNRDLQICATMALEKLASDRTVDALIDLAHNGPARASAITALGVIGDQAAVPHLREIARSTIDLNERRFTDLAIRRIEILNLDDPIPALKQETRATLADDHVDTWALRQLALIGDCKVVEFLASAMIDNDLSRRDREHLAASLLAFEECGQQALRVIASGSSVGQSEAQAALSLSTDATYIQRVQTLSYSHSQ